jgi:uncharacterized protein HemX
MSAPAPWGVPPTAAPAPAAPAASPPPMNAGSVLVLGILASGIVMWISGRARAHQEEQEAAALQSRVDEAHYDLEGAREDAQLSLAHAFAARPMSPLGWGQ